MWKTQCYETSFLNYCHFDYLVSAGCWGLDSKEFACDSEEWHSVPGLGRSPCRYWGKPPCYYFRTEELSFSAAKDVGY